MHNYLERVGLGINPSATSSRRLGTELSANQASDKSSPSWITNLQKRTEQGETLWITSGHVASWIGTRFVLTPPGFKDSPTVGVASSRLSRQLENHRDWFAALRTVAARASRNHEQLITVDGTTSSRFVGRAAYLFGTETHQITLPRKAQSVDTWLANTFSSDKAIDNDISISPPIDSDQEALQGTNLADRILFAMSDQIVVLCLRADSSTEQLTTARLADENFPAGSLLIASNNALVPSKLSQRLMDKGAIGWFLLPNEHESQSSQPSPNNRSPIIELRTLERQSRDKFLIHCTRRRDGPWPNQPDCEFLDNLILQHQSADHSALATLARIVGQQKLIASGESIRGSYPVVSFTEIPLRELSDHRVFRPHRGRWDFDRYGICVDRQWLISSGVRPVIYGNEENWVHLNDRDKPFFQLRESKDGKIDWTSEREWRTNQSVDLSTLPPECGVVFVPTTEDANHIASISRWPVTILHDQRK